MSLLAGRLIEVPFWGMVGEILRIVILPIAGGLAINHGLQRMRWDTRWKEQSLSLLSMIAICLICGIIVADARAAFAGVGLGFLIVIALHNALGYFLGYWGARGCGLPESSCRTIAIEVGMQNGGMGASLATTILHSSTIALASAIFGSWMTVVGSILAVYWSRSPAETGRSSSDRRGEPGLIDKT
jgi:BASS family bile acid:Na+ symporter